MQIPFRGSGIVYYSNKEPKINTFLSRRPVRRGPRF